MGAENELIQEVQEEVVLAPTEEATPPEPEVEAEAAGEEEAAEGTAEAADPDKVDEEPEITPEVQKRMDKLEKRLGYETRRREKLEKQISRQPEPEEADLKAPSEDDFDTYKDYQDALVDYKVQEGIRKYQTKVSTEYDSDDLQDFITDTLSRGRDQFEDFTDIAEANTVPITKPMLKIMRDNDFEFPEGIAYYLGKNLKEATAISRMSPIQATRALTIIEAKVSAGLKANPAAQPNNPPKNRVSNAPPPVRPTGSAQTVSKDPDKMTQREYEDWRNKGGGV